MKVRRKKGYYSISAVAEMFSVHPQTIRLYEDQGLIMPKRTEGNTRLFSEEDVNKLEEVIYLTHHLGINLAGVEMVLKLKRQINKMQKELNAAFQEATDELSREEAVSKHAIQMSASRLIAMKNNENKEQVQPSPTTKHDNVDLGDWEIEYEQEKG